MKCLNCNATLSCGCQKKVASNGTHVCANCIASYEINIKVKPIDKVEIPRIQQNTAPVITSVTVNK